MGTSGVAYAQVISPDPTAAERAKLRASIADINTKEVKARAELEPYVKAAQAANLKGSARGWGTPDAQVQAGIASFGVGGILFVASAMKPQIWSNKFNVGVTAAGVALLGLGILSMYRGAENRKSIIDPPTRARDVEVAKLHEIIKSRPLKESILDNLDYVADQYSRYDHNGDGAIDLHARQPTSTDELLDPSTDLRMKADKHSPGQTLAHKFDLNSDQLLQRSEADSAAREFAKNKYVNLWNQLGPNLNPYPEHNN